MKKMSKVATFVILAVVIAGIFLVVATVPQMVLEVWNYMSIDLGYKWVINMVVGFVIAIAMRIAGKKVGWGNVATNALSLAGMIIMIVLCECVFWHPKEFGTMLVDKISVSKIFYMFLGILASGIAYFVVEMSRKAPKRPNPEPEPEPEGENDPQNQRSNNSRRRRNDPVKD